MTTSEWKGRFFLLNESIGIANWNALLSSKRCRGTLQIITSANTSINQYDSLRPVVNVQSGPIMMVLMKTN